MFRRTIPPIRRLPIPTRSRPAGPAARDTAATATWSEWMRLIRDFATTLAVAAPVAGYTLLGAYFWHIDHWPRDLGSFGALAPAAFGIGLALLLAAPLGFLLPTLLIVFMEHREGAASTSASNPPPLVNGPQALCCQMAPTLILLGHFFLHPEVDPVTQAWALGQGLLGAVAAGLAVGFWWNAPRRPDTGVAMLLMAFTALTSLMLFANIASSAPRHWLDETWALITVAVLCALAGLVNAGLMSAQGRQWRRGRGVPIALASAALVLVVAPSQTGQPAWFPKRVAAKINIRTDQDVPLRLVPAAQIRLKEDLRGCMPIEAPRQAPADDIVNAQVLLRSASSWVLSIPVDGACLPAGGPARQPARIVFEAGADEVRPVPALVEGED